MVKCFRILKASSYRKWKYTGNESSSQKWKFILASLVYSKRHRKITSYVQMSWKTYRFVVAACPRWERLCALRERYTRHSVTSDNWDGSFRKASRARRRCVVKSYLCLCSVMFSDHYRCAGNATKITPYKPFMFVFSVCLCQCLVWGSGEGWYTECSRRSDILGKATTENQRV